MHGTGELSRVGVGWVPVAAGVLALLALTRWRKFPPAAQTRLCIFGPWRAHFFSAGGKRLPIDASQSASASGLESAVAAAADPAGDPGLAGTATGAAAAAAARSAGRGFSTGTAPAPGGRGAGWEVGRDKVREISTVHLNPSISTRPGGSWRCPLAVSAVLVVLAASWQSLLGVGSGQAGWGSIGGCP